jgi:hypothetical protein
LWHCVKTKAGILGQDADSTIIIITVDHETSKGFEELAPSELLPICVVVEEVELQIAQTVAQ